MNPERFIDAYDFIVYHFVTERSQIEYMRVKLKKDMTFNIINAISLNYKSKILYKAESLWKKILAYAV